VNDPYAAEIPNATKTGRMRLLRLKPPMLFAHACWKTQIARQPITMTLLLQMSNASVSVEARTSAIALSGCPSCGIIPRTVGATD
jgi:hypothetical protein